MFNIECTILPTYSFIFLKNFIMILHLVLISGSTTGRCILLRVFVFSFLLFLLAFGRSKNWTVQKARK
jgi:ammonia channel protein AmtB